MKITESIVGTRVKYIGENCCITNQNGTIIEDYDIKMVRVKFDTGKIYRLRKSNLMKLNESEENKLMSKLEGYYAVAVVKQNNGYYKPKEYHFAVYNDGNTYKAGDKVLVSGCTTNQPCIISEILTIDEAKERFTKAITTEVICKVDTSAYDKRVEERKEVEKRRKEANKIKKQMDEMIKKMDETKLYEMYSKDNPELAEKLKEYKELIGE